MKFISDEEASHRIAPKKNRCVWMEAGILSYLLCDREFDCEHCPLDEAMRSHYSPVRKHVDTGRHAEGVQATDTTNDTPQDRLPAWTGSTGDHVSVTVMEDGFLRISIEETAAAFLPQVRSVVLPAPGRKIEAGSFCCWFICDGGTLPIRIPFTGTVEAVNDAVTEHPHIVSESPSGEGWLFDVKPADRSGALRGLLSSEEAGACNFRDAEVFRRLIAGCMRPPTDGGPITMQDGGLPVGEIPAIIGPVKYLEIVRRAFWGKR